MSTTKAQIGKGAQIGYAADGVSAPTNFTPFLEVKKLEMPKIKTSKAKATHFLSPNSFHEYVLGWNDAGEITFTANYVNSDRMTLLGMLNAYHWFCSAYPDGSSDVYRGFISGIDGDVPLEEVIECKVSITITGAPVFAESTPSGV